MQHFIHTVKPKGYHSCCIAFISLAAITTMLLSPTWVQAQQPKLKDIIGKPAAEETAPAEQATPEAKKPSVPIDELERGVPRTSLEGFLQATRKRDYEKAARYLDLRRLPKGMDESEGLQLARRLKIVLTRGTWIDLETLSMDPNGHLEDGLPAYRDMVCQLKLGKKDVAILMHRVPRSDGTRVWKFASVTVANIPDLYEHFGYGRLDKILPEVFFDINWMGIELWMWLSMIMVVGIAYMVAFTITVVLAFILSRTTTTLSTKLKHFLALPVRLLLTLMLVRIFLHSLMNPTPGIQALLEAATLTIIILTWLGLGIIDYFFSRMETRFKNEGRTAAAIMFLPTVKNAAKLALLTCAIIICLDNIGFEVTTLIAGLGVGSIAVALAAQKSIENFIGAITLYTSRPVHVGDFCRFGETLGTVEQIGLRATRIRTLDHSIVTIPNAAFVNLHLDNLTERKKILYRPRISLKYGTSPDQVRSILAGIRKMLSSHSRVLPDPARVRFTNFGDYSLDLDIFAYIDENRYNEYLEIAEDINLQIMDIIACEGARLAMPTQTNYLKNGANLNELIKTN